MASPARPIARHTAATPPLRQFDLVTDDLLADILLRLPTLEDVGRAAASCAAFRRVVADPAFLRRLRSVHPAPLLALVLFSTIHPAKPLHSSARYARALAATADLSLSFLPNAKHWHATDSRDGRVLLKHIMTGELAVCDPLCRRYSLLPPIPGDPARQQRGDVDPFLVHAGDEEAETSFRVVCMRSVARKEDGSIGPLVAFVFSSVTGQWSSLAMGATVPPSCKLCSRCSYAYGCFYWEVLGTDIMLVLDTRSMEFSSTHNTSGQGRQMFAIVEAGEGKLGMYTVENNIISAVSQLTYTIQEIDEDGRSRWRFARRIRLPSQKFFGVADATDGYLLLFAIPWNLELETPVSDVEKGYFSFGLKSMRIEKMLDSRFGHLPLAKLYVAFPPSLCLPSI